jgi:hypothetical protein
MPARDATGKSAPSSLVRTRTMQIRRKWTVASAVHSPQHCNRKTLGNNFVTFAPAPPLDVSSLHFSAITKSPNLHSDGPLSAA